MADSKKYIQHRTTYLRGVSRLVDASGLAKHASAVRKERGASVSTEEADSIPYSEVREGYMMRLKALKLIVT